MFQNAERHYDESHYVKCCDANIRLGCMHLPESQSVKYRAKKFYKLATGCGSLFIEGPPHKTFYDRNVLMYFRHFHPSLIFTGSGEHTSLLRYGMYNRTVAVQNKSSLLLEIIFKNTRTIQLFKANIKTEIVYKSY